MSQRELRPLTPGTPEGGPLVTLSTDTGRGLRDTMSLQGQHRSRGPAAALHTCDTPHAAPQGPLLPPNLSGKPQPWKERNGGLWGAKPSLCTDDKTAYGENPKAGTNHLLKPAGKLRAHRCLSRGLGGRHFTTAPFTSASPHAHGRGKCWTTST